MNDLSLYILDIAQNSIAAKASIIEIIIEENASKNLLSLTIKDNGIGMTKEIISKVTDPFFTTRNTRTVGLGIPFLKMASNLAEGELTIDSTLGLGTSIEATFKLNHINTPPLGAIEETLFLLMIHPELKDLKYNHVVDDSTFTFNLGTINSILDGVPLTEPSIMTYLKSYIKDNIINLRRTL
jgi:hypothetical protein